MFDTHCHLNFSAFKKNKDEIINQAEKSGIRNILIPGTDIKTSEKAIDIASKHSEIYAAAGIHPHHIYQVQNLSRQSQNKIQSLIKAVEKLLFNKNIVAVGEVGVDRHFYTKTKYKNYVVNEEIVDLQKELLEKQIRLAIKYNRSLILHSREAVDDLLLVLEKNWDKKLKGKTVFHCCEPNEKLFNFAIKHCIYIGVDGDVTYNKKKQAFIKKIPLDFLVLETDSPFLLPEPLRSQKKHPNQPANLSLIADFVAKTLDIPREKIISITSHNAKRLFSVV